VLADFGATKGAQAMINSTLELTMGYAPTEQMVREPGTMPDQMQEAIIGAVAEPEQRPTAADMLARLMGQEGLAELDFCA